MLMFVWVCIYDSSVVHISEYIKFCLKSHLFSKDMKFFRFHVIFLLLKKFLSLYIAIFYWIMRRCFKFRKYSPCFSWSILYLPEVIVKALHWGKHMNIKILQTVIPALLIRADPYCEYCDKRWILLWPAKHQCDHYCYPSFWWPKLTALYINANHYLKEKKY